MQGASVRDQQTTDHDPQASDDAPRQSVRDPQPSDDDPPAPTHDPDATGGAPLLRLAGVSKYYGRRRVLHGLDLEIHSGDRIALLGPNGSGKTTLLRLLATTSPATAGTVTVAGIDARREGAAARRHTAYVSQDTPLYPELTPHEHLRWWRRLHGHPAHGASHTMDLLFEAGLGVQAHRPCGVLSGGQRRRLVLAMALATGARILLLDEPFASLDAAGADWLERRILEHDGALVMALHDPDQAERLATRRLHLQGGRLHPDPAAGGQA